MTKHDIADLRGWHKDAVDRSIRAGYDLVYVYAGHDLSVIEHFLSPRYNDRVDEYGGTLENRARLLREILEDSLEVAAGRAAIGCRLTLDDRAGEGGLGRAEIGEVVAMLAELPDLWDFQLGSWEFDSVTSRFGPESGQEDFVRGLKALTSKPVVGVGRFTSPDTMVRMIRSGVLDLIGAARPSIADPYLPRKIEDGRADEIRECIGCNVCVSGDFTTTPIRCTQNPSMGEEWRRGWHPERIRAKSSDGKVLMVGGGPSGLEASMCLGKRGYDVVLIEASRSLGGRVNGESRLPGLAEWRRVVEYRTEQLDRLSNVETYFESAMSAEEILEFDFNHVVIATGATWRHDGVGRHHTKPMQIHPDMEILTPDDLISGVKPKGDRVVLFDDDHYYMGGVLAELLLQEGFNVTLVTPAADVSHWTHYTLEQHRIQKRLLDLGAELAVQRSVGRVEKDHVVTICKFTGSEERVPCETVVLVTARLPKDELLVEFEAARQRWRGTGLQSVEAIGDALAPGTITAAVWDGHRYAEDLEATQGSVMLLREVTRISSTSKSTGPADQLEVGVRLRDS